VNEPKYIKRIQGVTNDGRVIEYYTINPKHRENQGVGLDGWINNLLGDK